MWEKVGEPHDLFPLCRSPSQSVIEADIENECLSRRVTNSPKIADLIATKKGLRKVPDFPGQREVLVK
jgi:hypothetical protein